MDRQQCSIMSVAYFELMGVVEQLSESAEIPGCTIELLEKARLLLEELGIGSRLELIINEIKRYNAQLRRTVLYHELMQAAEDEEEAERYKQQFMEHAERTNVMRLKLANFIIDTMKLIAEKAEEC